MEYTRNYERTFDVSAEPLLRIANTRGELTIRGADRSDIQFTAKLRLEADSKDEAEARFDSVELPIEQGEDTVEIGPPEFAEVDSIRIFGFSIPAEWRGPRMDMVAEVPRGCRIEADMRTGAARIEGINAEVRLHGRTGRMRVADIEGALTVEARTSSIEVRSIRGDVRVETRTGRVDVEDVTGDATVATRTGAVQARVITGALHCRTRTGAIRVIDCDGPFDLSTTTGVVEYRGDITHDGTVEVRTGRITLGVKRGASFFIDASSDRGSVRSELDIDDHKEPAADAPTVRLHTSRGSIRVVPAAIAALFATALPALAAFAPLGGSLTL